MQPSIEKELEQFFQPGGLGHVNQLATGRQQIRAGPRLETQGIQILDVNRAQCPVEVAGFAQRKTRVTRLLGGVEALGDGRFGVEGDDFLARPHHFAGDAMAQVERIEDNVAAEGGNAGAFLRRSEQQPQFLIGVAALRFGGGLDAELGQQPLRRVIEQPDEGISHPAKPDQRPRGP